MMVRHKDKRGSCVSRSNGVRGVSCKVSKRRSSVTKNRGKVFTPLLLSLSRSLKSSIAKWETKRPDLSRTPSRRREETRERKGVGERSLCTVETK